MKVTLDKKVLQYISLFQNLTGSHIIDCIDTEEEIYFIVPEGNYGLVVGKNGTKIKNAERVFKKHIKIFEYSDNLEQFIKNLIPEIENINNQEGVITIKVRQNAKARVIGKGGEKIKLLNEILKRLFNIESLKVK